MASAVGRGLLRRGWTAYTGALKSHPVRTNAVTSGCITVASDLVAQVRMRSNTLISASNSLACGSGHQPMESCCRNTEMLFSAFDKQ